MLTMLPIPFQVVSGGPLYKAEYVVVEANCTEDQCTPLNDTMAVSAKMINLKFLSLSKFSK